MIDFKSSRLKKFDTLTTGIISGLVLPVIVYFILYFAKIQDVRFTLFSHHLVIANIIPVIISHCILPNLLLFFAFNGLNWMQAIQRGPRNYRGPYDRYFRHQINLHVCYEVLSHCR